MLYDFDQVIDRRGTNTIKWDSGEFLKKAGITERFDQDTIPLFVADMDFPCPQPVVEAMHRCVERQIFGYSSHQANEPYFDAIRQWFQVRHDWDIPRESLVWCPGTVEALDLAVKAFTKKGEGVIIQQPVYRPFMSVIHRNERILINNALVNDQGYYRMDFEDLEKKAADPANKLMILCSPHNPVGRVWSKDELVRLADICFRHDVLLIADEIHGDLVMEDHVHFPICSLVDNDRIVSCTAINKSFNVAGLHCTNLVIPNPVLRETFTRTMGMKLPSPFAIEALIAAYTDGGEWLSQVKDYILGNFRWLDQFLKNKLPFVDFRIPEGTYIAWLDFSRSGLSPEEVHRRIYIEANVVLEDGEMFGSEGRGYQRICVPSPRPILAEAMQRIAFQFEDVTRDFVAP